MSTPTIVDRLAKLEREHAAVVRWLAAKDAEKLANSDGAGMFVFIRLRCELRRALDNLEKVAREVREG